MEQEDNSETQMDMDYNIEQQLRKKITSKHKKEKDKKSKVAELVHKATDHKWFRKPRFGGGVKMSVDEFIKKILEGEKDFQRITLLSKFMHLPNLTEADGFKDMNDYLKDNYEKAGPNIKYMRFDNADFRCIADGIYLPNFYAPGVHLEGSSFKYAVLPNLYFNEETVLNKIDPS
jgi:hypothetical protein